MTDKELHKLNRTELLEILISQSEENDRLQHEVAELKQKINESYSYEEVGTLADAAMRMSGIFEAAQNAADIYLYEVKLNNPRTQSESAPAAPELEIPGNSDYYVSELLNPSGGLTSLSENYDIKSLTLEWANRVKSQTEEWAENYREYTEEECSRLRSDAASEAAGIVSRARSEASSIISNAKLFKAEKTKELNAHIDELNRQIRLCYLEHPELRTILSADPSSDDR